MEDLDMIHSPKNEPISCQKVRSPGQYSAKHIHMHDTHEINLISSPSLCQVRSNGSLCLVQGPALILHTRGTYHALLSATGPFESHVIYFDPTMWGRELSHHYKQLFASDITAIPLSPEACSRFLSLFRLIGREEGEARNFLLLAVLAKIVSFSKTNEESLVSTTKNTYIFPLIRSIRERLGEKLTTQLLAKECHVSPTKLKTDFHAITGEPIKQFIIHSRLRQAQILLKDPSLCLAHIALACGFSGESHLIRAFRQAYGTTPGAWRKNQS